MKFLPIIIILNTIWGSVLCARILFLAPFGSRSHKIFFDGIADALGNAGHQITMISAYPAISKNENTTELIIKNFYYELMSKNPFELTTMDIFKLMKEVGGELCIKSMKEPGVLDVLSEDYDLAIASFGYSGCYFPYLYKKKLPVILTMPLMVGNFYSEILGNIEFPSVVSNILQDSIHPLSFNERMISSALTVVSYVGEVFDRLASVEYNMKKEGLWPQGDIPSIEKAMMNIIDLVIVNSVKALEYPSRPFSPNIVFAGGIHITQKESSLNEELQEWMEGSGEDGIILFSLGSATQTKYFKKEHLNIFLKVFTSLKQRILWKWDSEILENLPANVKISKWIPQQDILAHNKTKLFITHGGLLSTQEATYHAVPILGMPIVLDQKFNMRKAALEGWAYILNWDEFTEEKLSSTISSALSNSRMHEAVDQRSKLMKDLPLSPSEEVVYWVEYVLRYNGAPHLVPPFKNMPWYKIYNVDVWAVIIISLLTIIFLLITCAVFCIRKCFGIKSHKAKAD